MSKKSKVITASAILIGTIIGAGFLGIPSVVARSGFAIGVFYIIFIGILLLYLNLALGEISLRTKGHHQLTGYALRYLGKNSERLMFFAMVFGIYSAVLAYLIGSGKSFSFLFFGNTNYVLYFGIGVWIIISFLVSEGIKSLKKYMNYGVLLILFLIILISLIHIPDVNVENFKGIYWNNLFIPFGVILFAYLGFSSMPEIERYLFRKENLMKKSLLIGSIIPIIAYFIFTAVMVGVYGRTVNEISTLSMGRLVVVLGIITMSTSYLALSIALRDMFILDYYKSKRKSWLYTCIVPLVLFLIAISIGFDSFTQILSIGGAISGGLAGILILSMVFKAKREGNRKPEYSIPTPLWILILIAILFFAGILYEIFNTLRIV